MGLAQRASGGTIGRHTRQFTAAEIARIRGSIRCSHSLETCAESSCPARWIRHFLDLLEKDLRELGTDTAQAQIWASLSNMVPIKIEGIL